MAEFALPKHSKIVKGIDYPLKGDSENTKKINDKIKKELKQISPYNYTGI